MQKLFDYLLRIIMIVLILVYIVFCAITCSNNPQAKETQWMEWEKSP